MHPKDTEGNANSVDPDETAPSSLILVCKKLRKITVLHSLRRMSPSVIPLAY